MLKEDSQAHSVIDVGTFFKVAIKNKTETEKEDICLSHVCIGLEKKMIDANRVKCKKDKDV